MTCGHPVPRESCLPDAKLYRQESICCKENIFPGKNAIASETYCQEKHIAKYPVYANARSKYTCYMQLHAMPGGTAPAGVKSCEQS